MEREFIAVYMWRGKPVPKWEAIRFHALRGFIQTAAALTFFWSLTQLALAEATVIGFTAALMIAPIAWLILGERLTGVAVTAALIGFGGAALAASGATEGAPESGNRLLGAISCLAAALLYALTLVLMRLRTRKEDTLTIVMFTNVFPALILLPYLIATNPIPAPTDLPAFFGLAAAGTAVWWLMTRWLCARGSSKTSTIGIHGADMGEPLWMDHIPRNAGLAALVGRGADYRRMLADRV